MKGCGRAGFYGRHRIRFSFGFQHVWLRLKCLASSYMHRTLSVLFSTCVYIAVCVLYNSDDFFSISFSILYSITYYTYCIFRLYKRSVFLLDTCCLPIVHKHFSFSTHFVCIYEFLSCFSYRFSSSLIGNAIDDEFDKYI